MSLQVTNQKSEREQIVALRRQSVFMFIATHLDADGCFSESDQYIANTVAASERKSVSRTRQALESSGDVMVVEKDRYDKVTGRKLPNKVRPVPIKTFWVREWVRQGEKTETCVHGENASSRPRENHSNDEGLTPEQSASASTAKHRGHDHKNNTPLTESLHSLSVEQQSTEHCARWSVHGEPSAKYIDPPVKRALARLQKQLAETQAQQKISPQNPYWGNLIVEIEQSIAELEGR